MPGRLFIMPRDSAPCISRPLSRPKGPASVPTLPMPRRQQQDLDAAKTTTGLRLRLRGQTHDKQAAHQTRYALETVAKVSSHPKHRDHAKSRKNDSLVPSPTPRLHKPQKNAVSSHLKHRDHTKPQKNSSLVPSPTPRPHKIPEKLQSRPIPSTETVHYGRKGGMG